MKISKENESERIMMVTETQLKKLVNHLMTESTKNEKITIDMVLEQIQIQLGKDIGLNYKSMKKPSHAYAKSVIMKFVNELGISDEGQFTFEGDIPTFTSLIVSFIEGYPKYLERKKTSSGRAKQK